MYGLGVHVVTDPATGEQRVVMTDPGDAPITTVTVPTSGPVVYQDWTGTVIGTGGGAAASSFTGWLNQNSGLVVGVGLAFVGILLLGRAGR